MHNRDKYLTKQETWRFLFFCHFVGFEKPDILYIDITCSYICAPYTLSFHSPELSKFFICYKNMFLHDLHVRSYASVVLLANCYVDTLH